MGEREYKRREDVYVYVCMCMRVRLIEGKGCQAL